MSQSNSYAAIQGISIQFNNMSGILSSASPRQLYQVSKRNGSKQSLYEFLGEAGVGDLGNDVKNKTIGSVLVLSSQDLNLPNFLSSSSIGQFNFSFTLNIKNLDSTDLTNAELLVITQTNGILITMNGESFVEKGGLLTKDLLLNNVQSQFGESSDYIKSQKQWLSAKLCKEYSTFECF